MPLPKAGAELELDTSQWDSAYKAVLGDAAKIDAALSDLGGTVDVKINTDSSELDTVNRLISDLDSETADVKINADSADMDSVISGINDLKVLGAIEIALNFVGTGVGIVESLGRFSGIGSVLEMDNALSMLEARTGRMIPQAEQLIEDIYTNGWGESKTQIAEVIAQADNLKIANEDLETAVTNALIIQSVYGQDTTESLRTMDTMVKNNLAPDFQAASDILVTGLQTGADRGQDLLDTFNEYGSTFGNLRISGEGALALINSGLDAGIDNSDRIADSIRETGIRLGEIGTTPAITDAFKRLDELSDIDLTGMLDAFNAGEISGDEFFSGFFSALGEAVVADPVEAQTLAATLVGTISEDFGVESIAQLTPIWDGTMGSFEDRTTAAGTAISDNLGTIIETFLREIETAASDFLSSDAIDLDGKIDTLKTQLTNALSELSSGGSIGDALEIGFGVTGVDDALNNIQRVFGQFVISILEVVAFIKDPTGLGTADDATRSEIARLATQQLPFDIQVANPEELDGIFTQAMNRGVTDLGGSLRTALDELIASGDFEQAIGIIEAFETAPGVDPAAAAALANEYVSQLQTGFDEAIASGDFDLAKKIADAQNDPTAYTDAIKGIFGFDGAAFDTLIADSMAAMTTAIETEQATPMEKWIADAEAWATQADTLAEAQQLVSDAQSAMNAFGTDTEDVTAATGAAALLMSEDFVTAFNEAAIAAGLADESIAEATTGNTITSSLDAVGESAMENAGIVQKAMQRIVVSVQQADAILTGIAAKVTAVNEAIAGVQTAANNAGFGGGVVNNNTNVNIHTTNNVQSAAQAVANGYAIGASIRGMT